MQMPEITLVLFYTFNALRIAAYLPQILRVAADGDGAKAISYTTWCVWIGANGSTAAYALVITPSLTLFVVSALNALGCAAVVVLTAWKRHQLAMRTASASTICFSGAIANRTPGSHAEQPLAERSN